MRRYFCVYLVILMLFSLCHSADASEKVRLQLSGSHRFQYAGYYMALEKGFYADAGLDVLLIEGREGLSTVDEVIGKRADYAVGNSQLIFNRVSGADVVLLAVIFQKSPVVLVTQKPITRFSQLKGKKTTFRQDACELLAMLSSKHIQKTDMEIVSTTDRLTDFIAGKVDAVPAYRSDDIYILKQLGYQYNEFVPADYGFNFYGDNLFTSKDVVFSSPKQVQAVREATLKGWKYAMDNYDETIITIRDKWSDERSIESLVYEANVIRNMIMPNIVDIGHINRDMLNDNLRQMTALGIITEGSTLDGFLYDDYFVSYPVKYIIIFVTSVFVLLAGWILLRYFIRQSRILEEQDLKLKQAMTVFNISSQGIAITDTQGNIKSVNPRFTEITGYEESEVVGKNPRVLNSGIHEKEYFTKMWESIINTGSWSGELWNRKKDGSVYLEWSTITSVKDSDGNTVEYVAQFSEISNKMLTDDELMVKFNYDSLTGLMNRKLFNDRLEHTLAGIRGQGMKAALFYVEIDDFKVINETYGFITGDSILRELSDRFSKSASNQDIICRAGGDEFLVAMIYDSSKTGPRKMVHQLKSLMEQEYLIDEKMIHINTSIGVSLYPENTENADELVSYAELAMYKAKKLGKDRFCYYDKELSDEAQSRNFIKQSLKSAFINEEFRIFYQPIVDLSTGRTKGAEALLRWHSAEKGFVYPDEFICIAEETGDIKSIGIFLLDEICKNLAEVRSGGQDIYFTMNVSAIQIPESLDPKFVESSLRSFGLEPGHMVIEVTETALIEDDNSILIWLNEMKELGFRLALDDFGTGYSSLASLSKMPFDIIKIDKAFITNIDKRPEDKKMINAVVAMAHSLGLTIVCEGIENEIIHDHLRSISANLGQGYYYSRPMDFDGFKGYLSNH